jgi:hypothetical protein
MRTLGRFILKLTVLAACITALRYAHAGVLLVPDGRVTLIRGASVHDVSAPVAVEPGDIFDTGGQHGAQLQDGGGTLVALGPATRIAIDGAKADGALSSLSLLAGWIKAATRADIAIETPLAHIGMRQGSAVLHADSASTQLFVESGSATLGVAESAAAPQTVDAEHYALRAAGKPPGIAMRPDPAFVAQLPPAFRDPLAAIAPRTQVQTIAQAEGRQAIYADLADWLASPLPIRHTFVARFALLARVEPFRTQLKQHLASLPEWRPLLFPPPAPAVHADGAVPMLPPLPQLPAEHPVKARHSEENS